MKLEVPMNYKLVINDITYRYDTAKGVIIFDGFEIIKDGDTETKKKVTKEVKNGLLIKKAKLSQWNDNIVDIDFDDLFLIFKDNVRKPSTKPIFERSIGSLMKT